MEFNHTRFRYPSKRNLIYGRKGMVATGNPAAAQVGLDILKKGGNAIDAAIATAASLSVVEPSANGIGGDLFAIVNYRGRLYGLNSSGPSPKLMTRENILKKGYKEIPLYGLDPVTVPGIPKAWAELSSRFGNIDFIDTLEPAARMAEEGYIITGDQAHMFQRAYNNYKKNLDKYPVIETWFKNYTNNGKPPKAGEIFRFENQGKALREIAKTNSDSFYKGAIAEAIDRYSRENNGFIRKNDLENYQLEWVDPISINYKGYDIWELPPNGIGVVALMALKILEGLNQSIRDSVDSYHKQIEALKLAFIDGKKYIADPRFMNAKIEELLSDKYLKERASLIGERAILPEAGKLPGSGTVYLATADDEGNMVSLIQSCYTGFGSGVILPNWGIALHNRGNLFSLDKESDNVLEGGKRPYHTIIPGFISRGKEALGPFGIMGGGMQPQAHMQVISNMIDFNMNPQEALDAPRWQWIEGKKVNLEVGTSKEIITGLLSKGHEISISPESIEFGRGQVILRQENGVLIGGTEHRTDGYIAAY